MSWSRVVRQRLNVPSAARLDEVHGNRQRVVIDGRPVLLPNLEGLPKSSAILFELQAKSANCKSPASYLNEVRPFLELCSKRGGMSLQALKAYKLLLEEQTNIHPNTRSERFGYALGFVRHLQEKGVIPHFSLPKNFAREKQTPKLNLFDVAPLTWSTASDQVLQEATQIMKAVSLDRETALASATIKIRLAAIRSRAVAEISEISRLISETDEIINQAKRSGLFERFRKTDVFPSNCRIPEAIVWAKIKWDGVLPNSSRCDQKFYYVVKTFGGGFREFQKRFYPTAESLAPFLMLYLCEARIAPNVDSITKYTFRGCLGSGSSSDTQVVSCEKHRPKQKVIAREISRGREGTWTLPRALEFLHNYSGRLLRTSADVDPRVEEQGKQRLFIHFDKQRGKWITRLDPGTVIKMVKSFLERASEQEPELIAVAGTATGENFRPSHAFLKRAESGNIFAVQRLLDQGSANVTRRYSERQQMETLAPLKLLKFQDYIADQIVESRNDLPNRTIDVGNGFQCTDPSSGGPDGGGGFCISHDKCHEGCVHALIVLEDVESAADWLRWEQHIEQHRGTLEANYPERWVGVWEPRLALYKTLLERTSARTKAKAANVALLESRPMPALT